MSIAAENLPLPRRGDYQKKLPRRCRDAMNYKKKLPRRALKKPCRCRDGIRKNVLIFKAVTGLN